MNNKCNECGEQFDEPVIVTDVWCDEEDICYVCPNCDSDNWDDNEETENEN